MANKRTPSSSSRTWSKTGYRAESILRILLSQSFRQPLNIFFLGSPQSRNLWCPINDAVFNRGLLALFLSETSEYRHCAIFRDLYRFSESSSIDPNAAPLIEVTELLRRWCARGLDAWGEQTCGAPWWSVALLVMVVACLTMVVAWLAWRYRKTVLVQRLMRWMLEKAVRACGVRLETTPEQTPTSVSRSSSSGSTSSVVTLTGDALPGIRALAGSSSQRPNSSPTSRYDVRSELPHLQSYEDHLLQRNRRDAAVHRHQGRYGERMTGRGTIETVARRLEELRVSESVPAGQRYTTLTVAAGLDVTGAPLEPNTGPELPLALAEVRARLPDLDIRQVSSL